MVLARIALRVTELQLLAAETAAQLWRNSPLRPCLNPRGPTAQFA
jgi:hypothetical protein